MSDAKHSPLPWHCHGDNVDSGDVHEDGVRVAKCHSSTFAPPMREAMANAALIVRAVNNYAKLITALKLWDQGFVEGEQFDQFQFLKWVNDNRRAARAAIAEAEGTK